MVPEPPARHGYTPGRSDQVVDNVCAVIEIMRFRLADAATESAFLEADKELQEEFAYRQPGLLRRTTAKGADGRYVVIDLWRSAADADVCGSRWDGDPVVRRFLSHVEASSVETERYVERD